MKALNKEVIKKQSSLNDKIIKFTENKKKVGLISILPFYAVLILCIYNIILTITFKAGMDNHISIMLGMILIVMGICFNMAIYLKSVMNQKSENELEELAYYDTLTGIPNKRGYYIKLTEKISNAQKNKKQLAVFIVNIENFKKLNDTMGHQVGDAIIKSIASRLEALSEKADVFRLSGNEFVISYEEADSEKEIHEFGQMIVKSLNDALIIEDKSIHVTADIGYSIYPNHAADAKKLLQYADIAMSHAKTHGKNRVAVFEEEMSQELIQRTNLEQKIIHAIINEQFEMYYQPQYDFKNKKFRGFEALIRWYDEELGWVSPAIFIPIAEETGYIVEIGEWVLREVCATWKQWKDLHNQEGTISVNVSAVQLGKEGFVDLVKEVILINDIDPSELELEITETVFINDIDSVLVILKELKEIGVKLSLDDFGTGYSSLTYLKDMPMDTLKIDKSFISNITENNRQAEIADALIELVHKLNMETIAEGVETKEQYDFLKYMKCDNLQGFYTGKPMSRNDAEMMISYI